ncbi:MAG: hypothetical protein Q6373_013240 [Candidatus Sigynarchaeota archaeon]
MLQDTVYIIRGGSFGFNFDLKLVIDILAVLACIYDYRVNHRKDYFNIFLTATAICASFEIFIQLGGTRDMGDKYLFGFVIPLWISIPLQAMEEGGMIALLGILFGDRWIDTRTRKKWLFVFCGLLALAVTGTLLQSAPAPNVGGDVPSRRDMLTPGTLGFMFIVITINIAWFLKASGPVRVRTLYMLLSMVIFFSIWTLAEWAANTRWIELGVTGNTSRAPPLVEFAALAWDTIVEISLVFMLGFYIPYFLHGIKATEMAKEPEKMGN